MSERDPTFLGLPSVGPPARDGLVFVHEDPEDLKEWQDFSSDAVAHGLPIIELPDGRADGSVRVYPTPVQAGKLAIKSPDIIVPGCDRACSFCFESPEFLRDRHNQEGVRPGIRSITRWAASPGSPIEDLNLFGGNLFMQSELADIIVDITDTPRADGKGKLGVNAVSHGGPHFERFMKEHPDVAEGIGHIALSREAFDPALNDTLRGRFATYWWEKAFELIKALDIPITLNTTLQAANVGEIEPLIRMAYERGIRRVNFHGLGIVNSARLNNVKSLTAQQQNELVLPLVAKVMRELRPREGFVVDVETMFAPTGPFAHLSNVDPGYCAVAAMANLQIEQSLQKGSNIWRGGICPLYVNSGLNAFAMDTSEEMGVLYRVAGRSEVTDTHDCSNGCPVRQDPNSPDTPLCVISRLHEDPKRTGALRFLPGVYQAT